MLWILFLLKHLLNIVHKPDILKRQFLTPRVWERREKSRVDISETGHF
jgi:DNA-binding winged helix-turn-helix (wHTH) protein